MLRSVSARVRPAMTATWLIGSERKRSTTPDERSRARPVPVCCAPFTAVMTEHARHEELEVVDPGSRPLMTPPKT